MTDLKLNLKATTNGKRVMKFCIDHDFYTCGTCKQYDDLLHFADTHVEMNKITLPIIIDDIISHSDINIEDFGIDMNDVRDEITIMFLSEACRIYL